MTQNRQRKNTAARKHYESFRRLANDGNYQAAFEIYRECSALMSHMSFAEASSDYAGMLKTINHSEAGHFKLGIQKTIRELEASMEGAEMLLGILHPKSRKRS